MAHEEKLKDIIVSVWQGKTILLDGLIRHLSHESLILWERSHKTVSWDIFSFFLRKKEEEIFDVDSLTLHYMIDGNE